MIDYETVNGAITKINEAKEQLDTLLAKFTTGLLDDSNQSIHRLKDYADDTSTKLDSLVRNLQTNANAAKDQDDKIENYNQDDGCNKVTHVSRSGSLR